MDHLSEEEKAREIKKLEAELRAHGIKRQRKMSVEDMVAHDKETNRIRFKIAKLMNGVGFIPAPMPPQRGAVVEPFKPTRAVPAHLDKDEWFWLRENRYP